MMCHVNIAEQAHFSPSSRHFVPKFENEDKEFDSNLRQGNVMRLFWETLIDLSQVTQSTTTGRQYM